MKKDLFLLIEYARVKFTGADSKIADYFLSGRPTANIEELAILIGVSTASVTRFCKKLGLNNFKEFLFLYQEKLARGLPQSQEEQDELYPSYIDILQQQKKLQDLDALRQIGQLIAEHPVIHVFGRGFSALAAEDFKFRFSRLGKFIEVVKNEGTMRMLTPLLGPQNLMLVFSLKGQQSDMTEQVRLLRLHGVKIVVVTANERSRLLTLAHHKLLVASMQGEESTGMISSQLPLLMAIDHLYCHYVSTNYESVRNWMNTEKPFLDN